MATPDGWFDVVVCRGDDLFAASPAIDAFDGRPPQAST
jgi:hypothetical protein